MLPFNSGQSLVILARCHGQEALETDRIDAAVRVWAMIETNPKHGSSQQIVAWSGHIVVQGTRLVNRRSSPTFYTSTMFQGSPRRSALVVRCKGCKQYIPAPMDARAVSWIAVKCPICSEAWDYLLSEVSPGATTRNLSKKSPGTVRP